MADALYVPLEHSEQAALPLPPANEPAAQPVQADALLTLLKVPAGHGEHTALPLLAL